MSHSKAIIHQCLLALIIPLLLILSWYSLCCTQIGLQFSLAILKFCVPGHLHYAHATGTWMDDIQLEKVSYSSTKYHCHFNISKLHLSGHLLTIKTKIQMRITWQRLEAGYGQSKLFINPHGQLLLHGTFNNLLVDAQGQLSHPHYPTRSIKLSLKHYQRQWFIKELLIQSLSKDSMITFAGQFYPKLNINWQANALELGAWQNYIQGKLSGNGLLTGTVKKPQLNATLELQHINSRQEPSLFYIPLLHAKLSLDSHDILNLTLNVQRGYYKDFALPPLQLKTQTKLYSNTLKGLISLTSKTHTQLDLQWKLPHSHSRLFANKPQTIQAQLTGNFRDLSAWPLPWKYLNNPRGQLQTRLRLKGTLQQPKLSGQLHLTEGQFHIPNLGLQVSQVKIHLDANHSNVIKLDGQALSGQGIIKVQGDIKQLTNHPIAKLKVTGTRILTTRTAHLILYTTPKLHLTLTPKELITTGSVIIPEATIGSGQLEEVNLSADVRLLDTTMDRDTNQHITTQPKTFRLSHDLQIQLGNKVRLNNRGLSARIKGALHIKASPNHLTVANGKIQIQDGKYQAYGQDLTISEGELLFAGGPINNPGLNITAQRTITVASTALRHLNNTRVLDTPTQFNDATTQLTIGLLIGGTSEQPQINLFSEPGGLSQNDILSYLLLGRSAAQATNADTQYLWQAASALGAGSTQSGLGYTLKKSLKIDDISIESALEPSNEDDGSLQATPALVLGKRLNKNLYLSYRVGLLQPLNTLRLLYSFSKKWSVQIATGDHGSGVDMYYTIEKD